MAELGRMNEPGGIVVGDGAASDPQIARLRARVAENASLRMCPRTEKEMAEERELRACLARERDAQHREYAAERERRLSQASRSQRRRLAGALHKVDRVARLMPLAARMGLRDLTKRLTLMQVRMLAHPPVRARRRFCAPRARRRTGTSASRGDPPQAEGDDDPPHGHPPPGREGERQGGGHDLDRVDALRRAGREAGIPHASDWLARLAERWFTLACAAWCWVRALVRRRIARAGRRPSTGWGRA